MTAGTRIEIITISALFCLGIGLRVANVGNVKSRSPDELVYTLQAKYVSQGGRSALTSLVTEYRRDPVVRGFPPPTRLGYSVPLAVIMHLSGKAGEQVGRYLSCAASVGSLLLIACIGIRFFPFSATLFGLLFFAVSPMELAISRRAWTDALAELVGLLMIYAAAEITRDSRRRVSYLLFVTAGGLGIAVKETQAIAYAFCAIWVLWILFVQRQEWANGIIVAVAGLLSLAFVAGGLAWAVGGISVLAGILSSVPASNAVNQYAIEYQSGPGYLLLRSIAVMSPVAALFFLVGFSAICLSHPKLNLLKLPIDNANWRVLRWLGLFTIAYFAWPMSLPGCLNLRYVSVLFGIYYLIAGLGFWCVVSLFKTRFGAVAWNLSSAIAIIALCVAAATDYLRFERLFVRADLHDLAVAMVLDPNNPRNFIHVSFPGSSAVESPAPQASTSDAEAERETREGDALLRRGEIAEAMTHYENALALKPDLVTSLNNFAWVLSTAPEPSLRNSTKALELAEKAVRVGGGQNPVHLRTLAAAYAENGRFDEAITTAEEARQLALVQQNSILATNLRKDLYFYRQNHALHR